MILQALYRYSEREGLVADDGYTGQKVHFVVRLRPDGSFVGLESHLDEKGNPREMRAPKRPRRTVGIDAAFLVDTAQYALGVPKEGKTERARECLAAFIALIDAASEATRAPELGAVRAFLRKLVKDDTLRPKVMQSAPRLAPTTKKGKGKKAEGEHEVEAPYEWSGDEGIAFALAGDDDAYVHDAPAASDYWRARARGGGGDAGGATEVLCTVTGQLGAPTDKHDAIKGVPGAQSAGASLVSFNADAFLSQGFTSDLRWRAAPVTKAGADGYVAALNRMLEREVVSLPPRTEGGKPIEFRRPRQGILLDSVDGPVALFWTREQNEALVGSVRSLGNKFSFDDVPAHGATPSAADLQYAAESPYRGIAPAKDDDAGVFYALVLTGNAGRIALREWFTETPGAIKRNLRRYFDELALDGLRGAVSLRQLLDALQTRPGADGDKGGLPEDLGVRLFHAALLGTPYPPALLAAAVRRVRFVGSESDDARVLALRCALIKATLTRMHRTGASQAPGWKELTVALDETNTNSGYLCGRLFSLLERLQSAASGRGEMNATIRDRYYASAASTPAMVFPRLLALSVHHSAKVRQTQGGLARWFEDQKQEVMNHLRRFPRTLSLEDQGMFALGYYHQRAYRRPKGDESDEVQRTAPAASA